MFYGSDAKLVGYLEDMEVACSKALNRLAGVPSSEIDA
jgi:hypothetical protein